MYMILNKGAKHEWQTKVDRGQYYKKILYVIYGIRNKLECLSLASIAGLV
jgi:hypothetical protein